MSISTFSAFPSSAATSSSSAPLSGAAASSSIAATNLGTHLVAERKGQVLVAEQLPPRPPRLYQQSSNGSQCDRGLEKMSQEDICEMNAILSQLSGGAEYDINLTKLLSKKASEIEVKTHVIEDPNITRLRELVSKAFGHNIGWDEYYTDEPASRSGDQLFASKGTVLTNFAPNQTDRDDAHLKDSLTTKKPLTADEHLSIDRQYNCGSTSMQLFIKRLEQLKEGRQDEIKHKALSQLSGPDRISKIDDILGRLRPKNMKELTKELESSGKNPDDHNYSSLKVGAVLMEAITPLHLTGMTADAKEKAKERKEARWGEAIDKRNGSEPFSECKWWIGESEYKAEKEAFKKDGAAAGIEDRIDYEVLGNKKRAGQELFFIKLQKLQASNADEADIRKLVNSSLFDLVTVGLHNEDKKDLREVVIADALMVRNIAQLVTRDNAPPNHQEEQKKATIKFDQDFATALQEKAVADIADLAKRDEVTDTIDEERRKIEEEEKKCPLHSTLPWKEIPLEVLKRL